MPSRMHSPSSRSATVTILLAVALVACRGREPAPALPPTGQTIKVAVIGGMIETGFWQALAERYQAARGNHIEVVSSGPKHVVVDAFRNASLGADGVLHDLQEAGRLTLDPAATVLFTDESQHRVLERAAQLSAYTLVGRIPWITGKLKATDVELMVQGDPRLRRPFLVELSPSASAAARDLATYLRSPDTQQWIATFGRGKYDDQPLFFPVSVL
jgi:ABC-type tungstate transport system permease subunit